MNNCDILAGSKGGHLPKERISFAWFEINIPITLEKESLKYFPVFPSDPEEFRDSNHDQGYFNINVRQLSGCDDIAEIRITADCAPNDKEDCCGFCVTKEELVTIAEALQYAAKQLLPERG